MTLKLFLKVINEFHYDHSEKLGDAFEYLLSVLGSQGDAGQFRTPRHIIDFIVAIMQPKKDETICDPACGTAGFLISAYKYILSENTKKSKGDLLTPDDKKKLLNNFTGYDISAEMVRLSLVNMYLHGFPTPKIYEYDTLTSEDRWGDYFDTILANPPFMTPKGGIRPHKKFAMQANRSEVLFVDYIMEHINYTTGRAAIIVPEGIIFQSASAYKELRRLLVDKKYLYGVVSLPAGLFQPYSGVKTSILLIDKTLAKKTDKLLFVKIENDGFSLGAQRKEISQNDLPDAANLIKQYVFALKNEDNSLIDLDNLPANISIIEKSRIREGGEYNLSADKYKASKNIYSAKWSFEYVGDLIENVKYPTKVQKNEFLEIGKYPIIDQSEKFIAGYWDNPDDVFFLKKPVVTFGDHTRTFKYIDFDFVLGADGVKILQPSDNLNTKYFFYCLKNLLIPNLGYSRHWKELRALKIPLPPLSLQQEIVVRIEQSEKIILGANQVVNNYKPHIKLEPEWQMIELGKITDVKDGTHDSPQYFEEGIPFLTQKNITTDGLSFDDIKFISKEDHEKFYKRSDVAYGDILISMIGANRGMSCIVNDKRVFSIKNVGLIKPTEKLNQSFLLNYLKSDTALEYISAMSKGGAQEFISLTSLRQFPVPIPSFAEQEAIVSQIEKEQRLVNANKELIQVFEQKIKDEVNKLWEE